MGLRRKYMGSVTVTADVDVEVSEVLEHVDDDVLREEFTKRGLGTAGFSDFDLLGEIRWHLLRGDVQSAVAMIESAENARCVPEARRQHQFQTEHRPH